MSEALVERLRKGAVAYHSSSGPVYAGPTGLEQEAADSIEALEAREARLSEALREIAYGESRIVGELVTIARAALNGSGSGWRDGLSTWAGWDQSREHWGETKHKDAVLEAMFRGPWSAEDADALIGFIDRNWTERPAAPQQGGE